MYIEFASIRESQGVAQVILTPIMIIIIIIFDRPHVEIFNSWALHGSLHAK
ncbi:hypothetical protein ACLKA6_014937 [Drosophila palustris]